jgi:hypothetical protein
LRIRIEGLDVVSTRVSVTDIQSLKGKLLQAAIPLTADECATLQAALQIAAESVAHSDCGHEAAHRRRPRAALGWMSAAAAADGRALKLTDGFEGSHRPGRTANFSIR